MFFALGEVYLGHYLFIYYYYYYYYYYYVGDPLTHFGSLAPGLRGSYLRHCLVSHLVSSQANL